MEEEDENEVEDEDENERLWRGGYKYLNSKDCVEYIKTFYSQ